MLSNYDRNKDGLVFQKNYTTITYDKNYAAKYDNYGELNSHISHLRLGYIIGSLGFVPKSLLDVGYGNGAFLKTCAKIIDNCYGFDISTYPIPDGCEFVENWLNMPVDVITFFDSLEHFEDPYIIQNCQAKFIVGSVPWFHDVSDDWFSNWKHHRPNEHLWYFNDTSVQNFAKSVGYKVVNISYIEDVVRTPLQHEHNILSFVLSN